MDALEAPAPVLREAPVGPAVGLGLAAHTAVPTTGWRAALRLAPSPRVAPAPTRGGRGGGRVRDGATSPVAEPAPGRGPGAAVPFVLRGEAPGPPIAAAPEGSPRRGGRAAPQVPSVAVAGLEARAG